MKSRIMMMLSLLSIAFIQYSQAQTSSQNYIRTRTMTNENGTSFVEEVDYYDGLGRLLETVQTKAGGNSQDLIVLTDYDSYGRKDKVWLPVAVNANNSNYVAPTTLRSNAPGFNANDSKPYSQIIYEASPLNRTMKEFGPGNNWYANNRAIHTTYLTNNSSYPCALFSSTSSRTTISITRSGTYANNTLFVTKYQDEDNNISYEFKDKQDRILLTRQVNGSTNFDTYYIYDDYGNLRVVLSPLASDVFTGNSTWNESNATLQKYAYLYKYDNRNRCIAKKLPGADWMYYVYDDADRLIFSQNGEQRLRSEWSFNIPDKFGRIAINGICKNSFSYSSNPLNGRVISAIWATNGTGTYKGYNLEGGISLTNAIIQNVNYYDSYEFIGKNNVPSSLTFESRSGYATTYLSTPKGLLTGQITSELENNSTLYYSVNYYDSRSRLILNRSTNHLAGIDKEFLSYAFDNNVEKRCHIQTVSGKTQTEEYAYTYDQARRLKSTSHTLNGGSSRMLSEKIYDDLGRLQSEKLGGFNMLKATYNYDVRNRLIRNWCDQMGEALTYTYGSNVQTQSIALGTGTRIYEYAYDGLSRVTSGAYTSGPGDYTSSYSYDKNGNPLTVKRNGLISTGVFGIVDNLTFSYDGNHIVSINDAAGNIAYNFSHDFKNYSNQSVEYIYNANGCMTKDLNRGISEIQYNSLNLPSRIDIKSPVGEARNEYLYSSDGRKLRVKHSWNPNYSSNPIIGSGVTVSSLSSIETTDYIGNYEYVNNTLKRIRTEYGYIEGGVYHFYVKDHLGSNRLVVSEPMSSQAVNYYPFGMANGDQRAANLQSYKYTGKELDMKQGLNLYDYGARYYDPATCRFTTMDPMAEMYYSISPYAYCANNPLNAVDPSGMAIDWIQDKDKRIYWDKNATSETTTKAGETYLGKTVFATNEQGDFRYGDQYGNWWESAPLNGVTTKGIQRIGIDHISAAMRNAIQGYDSQWIVGFDQFLNVGLSAINIALTATTLANDFANLGSGLRGFKTINNIPKGKPYIGTKLEYIFGKATGATHNIERSTGMLRQLESIGIFDNLAGRSLLNSHLERVYSGTQGILQSNGRYLRESVLMGPRGGLKVESIWEGNKLITIKLIGGK